MKVARAGWQALIDAEPLLLLARASLVIVLINANDDPAAFLALAVVCTVALPRPRLMLSPWLWAVTFFSLGLRQLSAWHDIDDHIVASTYWCGAVAMALTATRPLPTLAAAGRLLVGTLFAFAAAWKLGSGEYLDGRFFRYTLLFDNRFHTLADLVGGTTPAMEAANHAALQGLVDAEATGEAITLQEGPRNVGVAWAFTTWGAVVELAVAMTFLLPLRLDWAWLRHAALIAFAVTTYVVVPIGGFGGLLLVLMAAMTASARSRASYLVASIVLAGWAAIWPNLFP